MNWPSAVANAITDAVGRVDPDGVVVPENPPMTVFLAAAGVRTLGDLAAVGVDAHDLADLLQGVPVSIELASTHWRLQRIEVAGTGWLIAHDLSLHERVAALAASRARAQQLLQLATSIVHDLSNHLNAGIGLASHVRQFVRDAIDLRLLDELTAGSQKGAELLRALVRLLANGRQRREWVDARLLLAECVAVVEKSAALLAVAIDVQQPPAALRVRTASAEAAQAMLLGLTALLDQRPTRIEAAVTPVQHDVAGGRPRHCAHVRFVARGVVDGTTARRAADLRTKLAGAFLNMRRLGGELRLTANADELSVDYWLPAATAC